MYIKRNVHVHIMVFLVFMAEKLCYADITN